MRNLRSLRRWLFDRLRRAYRRIGIHAAPPGTFFFFIHSRLRALFYRRLLRYTTGSLHSRARFGGMPFYDIARIRSVRQVDGLALIFFCGLGDYLFSTPVIAALRTTYPGLPIYAYAGATTDAVNSSLVTSLLRGNRYIDAVFTYRGRPRGHWLNYDFDDCLKEIPKNFVILPMVYGVEPDVVHRVTSLFETFQLPVRLPIPLPILESSALSPAGQDIAAELARRLAGGGARKVVCCHFGTRSSGYLYPDRDALVSQLLRAGHLVVTFSPTELDDPGLVAVDVAKITPGDTIELLRSLKADARNLCIISVNSVFWPISSGLGISNLGLHIFYDPAVHQYIYPNIFLLTQYVYPRVPASRVFLAQGEDATGRVSDRGLAVTDFDPTFVFDCFLRLAEIAGSGAARQAN